MSNIESYIELERTYKRLYLLAERLEEYALKGQTDREELKKLHYKAYNLKDEALRNWLDIKKKINN